jgi:hypothetical protein
MVQTVLDPRVISVTLAHEHFGFVAEARNKIEA